MDYQPLTTDELIELGRDVEANYRSPFEVHWRPITNVQMMASHAAHYEEASKSVERGVCCGDGFDGMGICWATREVCPTWILAKEIMRDDKQLNGVASGAEVTSDT